MASGIQLVNQFGEELVGAGKPTDVLETGYAVHRPNSSDRYIIGAMGVIVDSGLTFTDYPAAKHGLAASDIGSSMSMWRFAGTGFTEVNWSRLSSGNNDFLLDTNAQAVDDIVFWEVPASGIVHSINFWIDPPDSSYSRKVAAICPHSAEEVRYCIASRSAPADTSQTHGIQTFDAAGNLLYDSRKNNVVVRDFRNFTEAEVQDVLDNDTTITFTPRVAPTGSPMISISPMMSFLKGEDSKWQYLLIEWNGTSFTLSRFTQNVPSNGLRGFAYNGFTLTVADAEW